MQLSLSTSSAWRSPSAFGPPSIFTPRGIGYGPLSDSDAYSKLTRERGVLRPTTVIGIPIGPPSQSPEPKSAWTWSPTPIERTIASEPAATGSLSTRWFHAFVAGKTWHFGAAGIRRACADAPESANAHSARTARRATMSSKVSAQADWALSLALYSRFSVW